MGGVAALAGALALAAAVITYFVVSGGDDRATTAQDIDGFSDITPAPNTGMLVPDRPEVAKVAPDFALYDARDGRTIRKLSDFRGKPMILNWYASWCAPCRSEMPDFQAALDANPETLIVLGVDPLESREKALSILDETGAKYPALLDTSGTVTDHYRISGLPVTYFLDKDGVIRGQKTGRVTVDELVANLAKIGITYKP